jgi:hypothetical protein
VDHLARPDEAFRAIGRLIGKAAHDLEPAPGEAPGLRSVLQR